MQADLGKYAILYTFGGVLLDSYVECEPASEGISLQDRATKAQATFQALPDGTLTTGVFRCCRI